MVFLTISNFAKATPPQSTMSANISFNETPVLNKNVDLTVELLSIINVTNITANITLASGIELISGSAQWNVSLIKNITSNHTIQIKINKTGDFIIETIARDPPFGTTYMGARKIIYLRVNDTDTIINDSVFPAKYWNYTKLAVNTTLNPNNITINETKPTAKTYNSTFLRPLLNVTYTNETEDPIAGGGTITVTGRFLFTERDVDVVSARYVTVYLFDDDVLSGDDLLGTSITDENGYFSIGPVDNNDPEGGTQDIYVRFIAGSSVGVIQDLNNNLSQYP